jgi:MinD superfamily P-loop ATPase
VDLVFIVTEPSISGMHDLDRVLEVTTHFEIKTVVCINKYDINEQKTALIEEYCRNKGVEVIGKLPLSDIPMKAMLKRKTVIEYEDNSFARTVIDMWHKIAFMRFTKTQILSFGLKQGRKICN